MSKSRDQRSFRRTQPSSASPRRCLRLERLDDRRVLATITGMVFEDSNDSLRLDDGEQGLVDRIVYLDVNRDGVAGFGEPLQRTGADGRFQFDDLELGDYVVRLFNGTQSQQHTYPIVPELDEALIQIDDVDIVATSADGTAVLGLLDESVVRIDHASGQRLTVQLGGVGSSIHPLPDGTALVLADTDVLQSASAWIVSFDSLTAIPVDFGLTPEETGWASAAIDHNGDGVLIAHPGDAEQTTELRRLSFEDGLLIATRTANEVAAGSHVLSDWQSPTALIAVPGEQGLQLVQWSNSTGVAILESTTTLAEGVQLEAVDDLSGLAVVRSENGDLLVLDVANGFALLERITGIESSVVLDGTRELLFGRDEDSNLIIYDIAASQVLAQVPVALPRSGGMALVDQGNSLLMGGDYAILRVAMNRVGAHTVELREGEESADVLFGLLVQESNAAPEFQSDYTFNMLEDGTLNRAAPTLLQHGHDADPQDHWIVLKASEANLGPANVSPTGGLIYQPGSNLFGQDQFEILLHDGRSVSLPATVHLNIGPVNDPIGPFIVNVPPVPEDVAPGVPLGQITIENPDVGEDIDIEVNDPRFEVVNGQLILVDGVELDFETEPVIQLGITANHFILAENPADNYYESIFTTVLLQVTDANDAISDILLSGPASVVEHTPGTQVIGDVSVIDEDYAAEYVFAVDDPRFEIVDGTLQLKAEESLDYELDHDLHVTITVTDGPMDVSRSFAIEVLDVNEPPTDILFSADAVVERVEGAVVGELTVVDPDQPTTAQLSVDDSRFEFVGTTLKLRDGVSVSFAEQEQINLTLTAVDESEPPFTKSLLVTLNVIENPLPFHNQSLPLDVDASGAIEPADALLIINYLNRHGPGPIEQAISNGAPAYYDVNGDALVTPLDALLVINQLNLDNRNSSQASAGDGAGAGETPQGEVPQGEAPQGEAPEWRRSDLASQDAAIDWAVQSYYQFEDDEERRRS